MSHAVSVEDAQTSFPQPTSDFLYNDIVHEPQEIKGTEPEPLTQTMNIFHVTFILLLELIDEW